MIFLQQAPFLRLLVDLLAAYSCIRCPWPALLSTAATSHLLQIVYGTAVRSGRRSTDCAIVEIAVDEVLLRAHMPGSQKRQPSSSAGIDGSAVILEGSKLLVMHIPNRRPTKLCREVARRSW